MSADTWRDCPKCYEKEKVSIYGIYDFELNKDGSINTSSIHGYCGNCKTEFKGSS